MTFNDCGDGRGKWDSGCLGVVTCLDPDGNGDCVYPSGKTIADGTLCVTSGATMFNVCTGYDLSSNALTSATSGSVTVDCPPVPEPPVPQCVPDALKPGVCNFDDGTVSPPP